MNDLIVFQRLAEVLNDFGVAIGEQYKKNLTDSGRNASHALYNSIRSQVSVNGMTYDVELVMEEYWKYIEYGTKPHFPPVSKILEWVRIKPVLPTPMANGKLPTEEQLAWMIAKKIDREGTEGKPDLSDALDSLLDEWEQKISDALDADVSDCFDRVWALIGN